MPGNFYCLDNDIILKLATYDLFNNTLQALDIEENQMILKNIEQFGFNLIQSKIYQKKDCDMNLKLIFGHSKPSSENEVKESLNSEIIRLQKETKNLLYSYPNY